LNINNEQAKMAMMMIKELRKNNIKVELYPDASKMDKQFKHAERRGIPFVVKEITTEGLVVKDLQSGEQSVLNINQLIEKIK
jgi:histidyl-tRNA synthetase